MMAATEIDVLQSRVTRVEEALEAAERRIAVLEHARRAASVAPVLDESPPLFDIAILGKCVLIVGGAYLLRALTEIGLLPQVAGAATGFVYAMVWIAIADRSFARDRRTAALFEASIAAGIAVALLWEATARFRVFAPAVASLLTIVAAVALLIVARRWRSGSMALIAAAMTNFASIGLAIGTEDVVQPAIVAAVVGVVALRLGTQSYVTLMLAMVSDFLALALIAMAALQRTPHAVAAIVLLSIALLWVIAIEISPRAPESFQTAAVLFVGAGGASLFLFDAAALAMAWSAMAIVTAVLGRWLGRAQWTLQAPVWLFGAVIAAFVGDSRTATLLLVGALASAALALMPIDALNARLALLGIVTLVALAGANALLPGDDAGVLAMQRSVVLALTAVLLSLLGRIRPEAATLARVVLVLAGIKFLVEDFRAGRATTIVVALAAYGIAMLLIARRPAPRPIVKENA